MTTAAIHSVRKRGSCRGPKTLRCLGVAIGRSGMEPSPDIGSGPSAVADWATAYAGRSCHAPLVAIGSQTLMPYKGKPIYTRLRRGRCKPLAIRDQSRCLADGHPADSITGVGAENGHSLRRHERTK